MRRLLRDSPFALMGVLVCGLAGCATDIWTGDGLPAGAVPPAIVVHYFPYGPAFSRRFFAPVPDYSGWTNERMVRDLSRMARTGIDLAVVRIDLGGFLADDYRRERFERFVALAASSRFGDRPAPRILFEVVAPNTMVSRRGFGEFLDWFVAKGLRSFSSYYREDGRAVILLGPNLRAVAVRHPAVCFGAGEGRGGAWHWSTPGAANASSVSGTTGPERRIVLSAGRLGGADRRGRPVWAVPRRAGRTLRAAFRQALAQAPAMILISSWNDFERGDFIEPNSFDGDRVLTTLRDEIERMRPEKGGRK